MLWRWIKVYYSQKFHRHPGIDGIVVVCVEPWIPCLKEYLAQFSIERVMSIVPGGVTGQDSIYCGLRAAEKLCSEDAIVIIHDAVHPLITEDAISENIRMAREQGNCITCVPATHTIIIHSEDNKTEVPNRNKCLMTRAPQSFMLRGLLAAHHRAIAEGKHDFVDSCMLMHHYGHKLYTMEGPLENIKITTPADYFAFCAIINRQVDATL